MRVAYSDMASRKGLGREDDQRQTSEGSQEPNQE